MSKMVSAAVRTMSLAGALSSALAFTATRPSLPATTLTPPRDESMRRSSRVVGAARSRCTADATRLRMIDDDGSDHDDEDNPLSRGVDSVSWLPSVFDSDPSRSVYDSAMNDDGDDGEETLPLFPLGGIVYTPNSEHVLNIFEPRYRQMYNDILMNGSKRFAVSMSHPSEEGRFAQVGVVFSLEELKEVSEMTADQVKYICNHRVTGRVRLSKVVNPEAWQSRETYLKVRGTIIDDTGAATADEGDGDKKDEVLDETIGKRFVEAAKRAAGIGAGTSGSSDSPLITKTPGEEALVTSFSNLVEVQHQLGEDVRFTRASVKSFGVAEGTDVDPNLWTSIRLWQSYADQRLVARQNEMQKEFQEKLVQFLKKEMGYKGGGEEKEMPSAIGFQDLSEELQLELQGLQRRMTAELKPLLLEQTLSMQKILEASDHDSRIELMRYFVDAEQKRLGAKRTLQSMFKGETMETIAAKKVEEDAAKKEMTALELKLPKTDTAPSSQLFSDDEDSFQ